MYTETFAYAERIVRDRDRSSGDGRNTTDNGTLTKYSSDRIPQGTFRIDHQPEGNARRGEERGREV